jgi:hypothetical protein
MPEAEVYSKLEEVPAVRQNPQPVYSTTVSTTMTQIPAVRQNFPSILSTTVLQ